MVWEISSRDGVRVESLECGYVMIVYDGDWCGGVEALT